MTINFPASPTNGQVYTPTSPGPVYFFNSTQGTWQILVNPAVGSNIAPLASPVFTGTPLTPTAAIGTNSTQIASTAFVASSGMPLIANMSSLKASTTSTLPNAMAYVAGYYSVADGGEGLFIRTTDTTSSDNGGTIIVDASLRRWKRAHTGNPLSVSWFGALPGGPDCTPAFQAALAALPTFGGEIHFSAGEWTFSSQVQYSYPATEFALTLTGEGTRNTALVWPGNGGIVLNATHPNNVFHIRDITFRAGATSSGTALTLNQPLPGGLQQNDITRVTFDSTSGNRWNWAVQLFAWCNVEYDTLLVHQFGANGGVQLQGNVATPFKFSVIHNFIKCGFYGTDSGISYGTYVQGVTISQTNFTNGITGIYVPPGSDNGELSQLCVSQCQFGVTGSGINVQSKLGQLMVNNCLFIPSVGGSALNMSAAVEFSFFTHNIIPATTSTGTSGILTTSTAAVLALSIIGNLFQGLGQAITLGAATNYCNVQSNLYTNCTFTVVDTGPSNTIGGGSA